MKSERFTANSASELKNKKTKSRRLSSWVEIRSHETKKMEPVKLIKRTDIPKVIYIRDCTDMIKQLSSIGAKTY